MVKYQGRYALACLFHRYVVGGAICAYVAVAALLEMVAIAMYSLAMPRGMYGATAMVYAASSNITHIMVLQSIPA
jgi:hypothetical protein